MTLRGWLASWRRLHILRGERWEGDADLLLRAIRTGTSRRLPLGAPKRRVRMPLLSALLKASARTRDFQMGAACCLAYVFALRVPSELLGQGLRGQFVVYPDKICLVGLRRKGRQQLTELVRSCTCRSNPLACPHPWVEFALNSTRADRLFAMSSVEFHSRFRALLAAAGVPADLCVQYTSHAFRRGVAADVLERHGLQAMLAVGQWQSPRSASHYASWDEMDRHAVGTLVAEASDDDR